MKPENHIGFPFTYSLNIEKELDKDEEWDKHVKISKLLDIPLRCPCCGEVLRGK